MRRRRRCLPTAIILALLLACTLHVFRSPLPDHARPRGGDPVHDHPDGLTLFTTMRRTPREAVELIAIRSWISLNVSKIVFFVENPREFEEVVKANSLETGAELVVRAIPAPLSETGSPRVDLLFAEGEASATTEFVAFVNSDIVLPSNFARVALDALARYRERDLLIVGPRYDCRVNPELNPERLRAIANFEQLERVALSPCWPHGKGGEDYFVYRKGFFARRGVVIPEFWIGKFVWDHFLVHHSSAHAVDASPTVFVGHLSHEHHWRAENNESLREAAEREIQHNANLMLARCVPNTPVFACLSNQSTVDVAHQLCPDGSVVPHADKSRFESECDRVRRRLKPHRRIFQNYSLQGISPNYWSHPKFRAEWAVRMGC